MMLKNKITINYLLTISLVYELYGIVDRRKAISIVVPPVEFGKKILSQILVNMIRKLLNMLGFSEEMLANLFGNLINKLSNVFEKLIDKRIVIGNLIGKLPSMFENLIGKISNVFVNLPNKFSNKFEILRGVFGDVRDNFGKDSGYVLYRNSKIGNERILCSI